MDLVKQDLGMRFKITENDNILVSICCITYNHEDYIADAIEGFLMQEVDFPIEIIIHDDASTDDTASIIKEYEKKYPKIINPIYQQANQYSKGIRPSPNIVWPRARGKYIALCEGDDYWTDPLKLQKQVEFMVNNPECSLCFHAADYQYVGNSAENSIYKPERKNGQFFFNTSDVLKYGGALAPTCSILFSQAFTKEIPGWFVKAQVGDFALLLFYSLKGKLGYIDEVMTVYRLKVKGSWSADRTYNNKISNIFGLNKMLFSFGKESGRHYLEIVAVIFRNLYRALLITAKHFYLKFSHRFLPHSE